MSVVIPRFDVLIIGGGPAGLSAALILGRCRRTVLVCDDGHPRNQAAQSLTCYLSRDGIPPLELLRIGREELQSYSGVQVKAVHITDARRTPTGFEIKSSMGEKFAGRKLLLATGLVDEIPPISGIDVFYGKSVFICPYCDGWEVRDRRLAVYGKGRRALEMSRALRVWSNDLILFTNGRSRLHSQQREELKHMGVELIETGIDRLYGTGFQLEGVALKDGRKISRDALFFDTPSHQKSSLAEKLGCQFNSSGGVLVRKYEATQIPGLYVAGNIIKDVQLAIVAAAEGAKAGLGINKALTREDFQLDHSAGS